MSNEGDLDDTIQAVEEYFFGKGEHCGEMLFINFAKENKKVFQQAKLSGSTENNFEFTQLHKKFQKVYESELEKVIIKSGMNSQSFYDGLSERCAEGDQEVILFVDIINEIVNYNSFIEMMANLVNKV
jgi:hypothetical protein